MSFQKLLIGIAIGLLTFHAVGQVAGARPQYKSVFNALYDKELGRTPKFHTCAVCHELGDYKIRNNYLNALAETFDGRNVKDMETIVEILKKTEDKDSDVPGKTFGDLIREGRLPASK